MEGKSSARNTGIERFFFTISPIDNVRFDASVRYWVWNFFIRRTRLKFWDFSKSTKFGYKIFFEKRWVFPQNLYDFCQCRNFFYIMDWSQTYSKFFKGKIVELSNLRRKFALPTNFDSWFTKCVISQQNSVSVEFVLWTFWLRKLSI